MPKYRFTITELMVKSPSKYWGDKWTPDRARLVEAMGHLQVSDIGKRVYEVESDGSVFFQVENDSQLKKRLKGQPVVANGMPVALKDYDTKEGNPLQGKNVYYDPANCAYRDYTLDKYDGVHSYVKHIHTKPGTVFPCPACGRMMRQGEERTEKVEETS